MAAVLDDSPLPGVKQQQQGAAEQQKLSAAAAKPSVTSDANGGGGSKSGVLKTAAVFDAAVMRRVSTAQTEFRCVQEQHVYVSGLPEP